MKKGVLIILCILNVFTSIGQIKLNENTILFNEIEGGQCYNLCPRNNEYKIVINEAIFSSKIDTLEKGIKLEKNNIIEYGKVILRDWNDNFCNEAQGQAICFVELKDTLSINVIGEYENRLIVQKKILLKNVSLKILSENEKTFLKKIPSGYYSRGVTFFDIKKRLIALGYNLKSNGELDDTKEIIQEINLKIGVEPNVLSREFLEYIGLAENCFCEI